MATNNNDNNNSGEKKMQKSYFDVLGICCSSEVPLIEKILKSLEGVKDVNVVVSSKTVIVMHDTLLISQLQIVKVLNQARLEANVRGEYGEGKNNYRKKWPNPFAVGCGILLLLSFLKYVYHPFQWLALAAVAVGIFPIILKAITSIRNYTLDINILMLIAVGGSIALKDYWEAGTIVFLFTTAEWLESRASHKADAVMSSLVNLVPQSATLASGEEVNLGEVKLNTLLAVKDGDIIPLDGTVVEGKCEVDEKTLTGESFPVPKQIDSIVWAGTLNLNGYITVKTTALAEDCVVARMANLVEEAQNNKSKTQRFIDKCAKYYTPAVVFIAICIAVVPAAMRVHDLKTWFHLALVVLVSGCPCALILSTPVATYCALSKAATSGLLVKGAEYLETLAKVKIMAFDKTGTITRGEFLVTDFQSLSDDFNVENLLYWVSSIECKSSHPMAAALVDYAKSHLVEPMPEKVEEFQNFPGEGIRGSIDGKYIYIGNQRIAARAGSTTVPTFEGDSNEEKSIGYIFCGSTLVGTFRLSDVCRTGVKEAIRELKPMGIKTAMLTGDSQNAANSAQDQLDGGIEEIHAELLPEDKVRIIKEFQKISPTAMIGDGVNDAAALATADIGISMGISGSALAMETGQIILLSNDMRKIPKAVRLARRTKRKVIENVILSISTKAGIIALALAGHPLVWAAVLADVGTCLLVIFNSMLLLGTPRLGGGKSGKSSAHVHKHGRRNDCCSGTSAEAKCTTPKCGSKHEPEKDKCSSSGEKHGTSGCLHAHEVQKPDHHGPNPHQHGCSSTTVEAKCTTLKCRKSNKCSISAEKNGGGCLHAHEAKKPDDQGLNPHQHGCSGTIVEAKCTTPKCKSINKCSSSAEKQGGCLHGDDRPKEQNKSCCHGTTVETKCTTKKCSSGKTESKCSKSPDEKKHGGGDCAHDANKTKEEKKRCCSDTTPEIKGTTQKCSTSCENNNPEKQSSHLNEKLVHHVHDHVPDHQHDHDHHDHDLHDHDHHDHDNHHHHHHDHDHDHHHHDHDDHDHDYITEEAIVNMVKECCKDYNRHVGGCCKSFRKECCGKNSHFGVGFAAGGLSEIVIE